MAVVGPGQRMSVRIDKWLGLNLSPDGDTGLRHGEAAVMRNFRVTADGNLRTRPGYAALQTLAPGRRVDALWGGSADGRDVMTALIGGRILEVAAGAGYSVLGTGYGAYAHFFGFGGKVYCLTGSQYLVWSGKRGDVFAPVSGYVPIVTTATPPAGGGTPLESVNLLTPQRRQRFSPDGTSTLYKLLDAGIQSVNKVTNGGAVVPTTGYTVSLTAGTVTFGAAPAGGVPNSVEITYTAAAAPDPVLAQKYSAVFGGATDARVWLYGDGGARVYHSGLDEFGVPTAEYFPVDGEMLVDVDNKPVTGMVRQYDRLIVTKRDSTYQIGYDTLTDALGRARAAFYLLPVNGVVGSEAPGQACLVLNDPVMPHNGALYELRASQVRDERNMRDVSERVAPLLAEMDLSKVLLCDHERETELLIYQDGRAAVWNYGKDLWYEWDNLPMTCLISWDDRLFFGTNDGRICEISNQYRNNDKIPIISRWESGAMDFGMMDRFKYSKHLFVTVKPASQGRLVVTVETNRGPAEAPLTVTTTVMTFAHANFRHWNFGVNRRAQVEKIRLKARKFSTYKLIFSNDTEQSGSAATVLAVSIEVQTCGQEAKRL